MRRAFLSSMASVRMAVVAALASVLGVGLSACGDSTDPDGPGAPVMTISAELARTSYGVPHVKADNFRGLGYGLAYAYAQDNVCMLADSVLTVRGERSRFFGPLAMPTKNQHGDYSVVSAFMSLNNEDSDFFFKGYLDIDQLKAGYANASEQARDMLAGYAQGYNRYLRDYAGKYPAACANTAWVRPITVEDVYLLIAEKALHATGQVFAKEIVLGALDPLASTSANAPKKPVPLDPTVLQRRLERLSRELGSNALALGKDLTVHGRGMLLGNPHYPWTSTDRFYQAHLTVPGRYDAMGVILGGIPIVVIGFNNDVAWTHTVTTAVHFTTLKLALDPADTTRTTYVQDGVPVKMRSKVVTVERLQAGGSIDTRTKTFFHTSQGAVLVMPEAGIGWTDSVVHVLADPNRNNTRMIDQWIGIGSARNVRELKTSLDSTIGLPWVNTVAADRDGNVLFADASVVPQVAHAKFASDCLVVPQLLMFDGSRTACAWGTQALAPLSIFSPADGPWMIRTDFVGNSNDSYWLSNPDALLGGPAPFGFSPLYGRVGVAQSLRTRIGFKQLQQALQLQPRLALADLQQLAFANRVHAAELVLPQLLPMCLRAGGVDLVQACNVLATWDKRSDLDSRGALLFREFWSAASAIPNKWALPFDAADPVNTPRGIAMTALPKLLAALRNAIQTMKFANVPIDGRLGDFQVDERNGKRIPIHGGTGDIDGSYNSIYMNQGLHADGYGNVDWGTSYIQTVTFDDKGPVAQALLLYGQSVDPASPHYADQLPLYSTKTWPVLPFKQAAIMADPAYQSITIAE